MSLIEVIDSQNEVIKRQSELIAELAKILSQYMTAEELENVERGMRDEEQTADHCHDSHGRAVVLAGGAVHPGIIAGGM